MIFNIRPAIIKSFRDFKNLQKKVNKLYIEYALKQKKKILDFYNEIFFLETENISSFNIDIIDKVNNLNKHINFVLFGENKIINNKLLKLGGKIIKKFIPKPISEIMEIGKEIFRPVSSDEEYDIKEEKKEEKKEVKK